MTDSIHDRDLLRKNNFGALRLVLAVFVIVSHMFPAYGPAYKPLEPLMRLTGGQMDLGALAVNAFFAISGFLITMSWMRTPRFGTFLMKRVMRIYPGFLLASLICLLIVAPLSGAKFGEEFSPGQIALHIGRILMLSAPNAHGAFSDQPLAVLNLALWTIRYEFLCYLLVPVLVIACARAGRLGITALFAAALIWHASQGKYIIEDGGIHLHIIGSTAIWPRFLAYFLAGMALARNKDLVPFRAWIFAACVAALIITALTGGFFIAFATAGIYAIFYLAYQHAVPMFNVGNKRDFSYGVYLYGWPMQMLLVQQFRDAIGPWTMCLLAIPAALAMAAMSWYLVESPFMREKAKLVKRVSGTTPAPFEQPPPTMPSAPDRPYFRRAG